MIKEILVDQLPNSCASCDLFRHCSEPDVRGLPVGVCFAKTIYFTAEDLMLVNHSRPDWCPMKAIDDALVHVVEAYDDDGFKVIVGAYNDEELAAEAAKKAAEEWGYTSTTSVALNANYFIQEDEETKTGSDLKNETNPAVQEL